MAAAESMAKEKPMGVWGLVFVAYFWVSGGMYGVEPLIKLAPPAYVFLTILLTPIVYCIPIALICTDLSIAYPFDGGFVAWIDLALGRTIGAHNTFWSALHHYSFEKNAVGLCCERVSTGDRSLRTCVLDTHEN